MSAQVEHAERLNRLERRQDDDSRLKSVWGASSPFPGMLSATPQQGKNTSFNPAAEAFKNFDQDQGSNVLGGLHLETEEEPRRGASRANSVRFDESSLHGHFTQASRSSSDFFPLRTGSGLGGHILTERSSSHKSDGRQSSGGHSTRLNSLRLDTRYPAVSNGHSLGPPPGFLMLPTLPSIIRCWLDVNFSNENLVYAAICTGSCQSVIGQKLAVSLGVIQPASIEGTSCRVRLNVFFAEATFHQTSSRPNSPAPQLPMISVDFMVLDIPDMSDTMQVVIGADALRARNADIMLSEDRLSLYDELQYKILVPLVRPENAALYQNLLTIPSPFTKRLSSQHDLQITNTGDGSAMASQPSPSTDTKLWNESASKGRCEENHAGLANVSAHRSKEVSPTRSSQDENFDQRSNYTTNGKEQKIEGPRTSSQAQMGTPTGVGTSGLWGPWRRDAVQTRDQETAQITSSSNLLAQKGGRGRGMKVLKPSRSNTTTQRNLHDSLGSDALVGVMPNSGSFYISSNLEGQSTDLQTARSFLPRTLSQESRISTHTQLSKPLNTNPVGGASAFGWLNPPPPAPSKASVS
ncbi:hypothetical protein MMC25_005416 [Agyrium rufum]|nr:hypothetical protein [Agyrium rufum]